MLLYMGCVRVADPGSFPCIRGEILKKSLRSKLGVFSRTQSDPGLFLTKTFLLRLFCPILPNVRNQKSSEALSIFVVKLQFAAYKIRMDILFAVA